MKLDATVMRTMNRQDFRVLEAVEKGMENRTLVPVTIIAAIANLRHGGTNKIISSLHRDNLLSHDQSCGYDGYRLTNSGYDILALWNLKQRGVISALGDQIGVGKESDVYIAASPEGKQIVLKFHRLGRTSFRDVKKKRDYFMINSVKTGKTGKYGTVYSHKDQPNSWLFLSRISALKEYTFMKALYDVGYPTPRPITHSRHVVAMGLIRGIPLYQLHRNKVSPDQAESIFEQAIDICKQLARNGLVHCDLNEFNLMVDLSGGVQSSAKEGEDEYAGEFYVRHSGSSASVATKGQLTIPFGQQHVGKQMDGTGEIITEEPPKPKMMLENGMDARPVVTLIDFPQMVSVRHPNAKELWERDIACLKRFFVMKLKCNLNEEDWERLVPIWEDLIANINEDNGHIEIEGNGQEEEDEDGEKSVLTISSNSSLVPKKQLRLDQVLQASGFSKDDAARKSELLYYEPIERKCGVLLEDDEDDEKEEDTGTGNEEKDIIQEQKPENDDYDGEISDKEDDYEDQLEDVHVYTHDDNDDRSTSHFSTISRAESYALAKARASERVRRQLAEMKKASKTKGAFRKKNSNKTFVKGKRGVHDFGL
jgi:RIO-like serine/threonine protein kinase fused to N-terminal HTH domain